MQKEEMMELARGLNEFRKGFNRPPLCEMKEYYYIDFENETDGLVCKAIPGQDVESDFRRAANGNIFNIEEEAILATGVYLTLTTLNKNITISPSF